MASSETVPSYVYNILQTLESTIDLARQQLLEESPSRENVIFDADTFWTNFTAATKLVSHEATKFCMIFNEGVILTEDECRSLADKIERTCINLLAVFVTLPKVRGKYFYDSMKLYVADILQGVKNLCAAIKIQSNARLQTVGDIWKHCEAVELLPRDNRDAVLAIFREQEEMVQDASQELMDSLENEDDTQFDMSPLSPPNGIRVPPQTWTDSDRNVLLPASGLLKAAKACIKKTAQAIAARGDGTNQVSIVELDGMAEIVKESSKLADDLVLSLYPPLNHSVARDQASILRNNSKNLLSAVKESHFFIATDETWVEFLKKAVDHNWVRINDMILTD